MSETITPEEETVLMNYWLRHYVGQDGLCVLCHNSGLIQLRNGQTWYCTCPNGIEHLKHERRQPRNDQAHQGR